MDKTDKRDGDGFVMHDNPETQAQATRGIDFSTFIISLNSSALVNFGKLPIPGTNTKKTDYPAARQIIEMLAMLTEKTKGNLTEEEEQLLKSILHDLRLKYINRK